MPFYNYKFMYDNQLSTDYGLILCTFDGSGGLENITSSKIEFSTYKSPLSNKWQKYGYEYTEPMQFTIQVAKHDFSEITKQEVGQINRWLVRSDGYHWFQFYDNVFDNIFFNCVAISSEEIVLNGCVVGMNFEMLTDSPYGYSEIKSESRILTNQAKSFSLQNLSDETGHIYPKTKIEILENGDFDIYNSIESRTMSIKNCTVGEIITIDGEHKIISTTNSLHKIYNDFNWKYFRIANSFSERENIITVSLNSNISMNWREIRKVGV